jgi:acetoin utilization deacetylase AcuC-like enzyme
MRALYADHFVLPLPDGHRFPMAKYARLRERVAAEGAVELVEAPPASIAELERAHDAGYVARAIAGELTAAEIRAIGFPWSEAMIERSRRSSGATVAAARFALADGVAVNLAGGTHHAGPARGQGYCVFNDAAVAARAMIAEGRVARVLVIDTDVHQGNGTAEIFADDPAVFTFSIHGEKNFPFHKATSDLDVGLPDGADDAAYLDALSRGLTEVGDRFSPDLAIWVSGVDPWEGDRLGRLKVTRAGLAERDRRVLDFVRDVPVAVTMAGGYAPDVDDIADLHLATVRAAHSHATGPYGRL